LKPILTKLVKYGKAEKKRNEELYRPAGSGAGGHGKGGEVFDYTTTPPPSPEDTVRTAVGVVTLGGAIRGGTFR